MFLSNYTFFGCMSYTPVSRITGFLCTITYWLAVQTVSRERTNDITVVSSETLNTSWNKTNKENLKLYGKINVNKCKQLIYNSEYYLTLLHNVYLRIHLVSSLFHLDPWQHSIPFVLSYKKRKLSHSHFHIDAICYKNHF